MCWPESKVVSADLHQLEARPQCSERKRRVAPRADQEVNVGGPVRHEPCQQSMHLPIVDRLVVVQDQSEPARQVG